MGFEIGIEEAIDNATSEETFDVLAFVKGSATPEENVTLYTDADAAMRTARSLMAEKERNERKSQQDEYSLADDYDEEAEQLSEEELDALHERLVNSSLTFRVKGLAPAALSALEKSLQAKHEYKEGKNNPEYDKALELELIARSIVSITGPTGKVNKTKWDAEKVSELTENLYPSELNKLFMAVAQINYVAAIFDKAVSADFS